MAAAGAGASILEAVMMLRGVEDTIGGLRRAGGGFDQLRESADRANDAIAQIRNTSLTLGGTAGQTGALASAFGSIGLSIEQLRGAAEQFRERLFTDPIAQTAFGQTVLPARLGGPQDSAAFLDQAIQMLRETRAAEERLFLARRLGLETLLPLADAEPRFFEAMRAEGQRRGAMVDEELRTLRANSDTMGQRITDLRSERDLMRERIGLRFGNWWRDNITLPLDELLTRGEGGALRLLGLGPRKPAAEDPMEQHSRALRENTAAILAMNKQIANGSQRAAGAIPRGLTGSQFVSEARALGAFEA